MSEPQLPFRITSSGWGVLTVGWWNIPDFNYDEVARGMADEDRRRELDLDWLSTSGVRVFPQFSQEVHVAKQPIPFNARETLYLSFDWGLTPAFAAMQMNSYGQLCILSALAPDDGSGLGTWEFGDMVAQHLIQRYCLPHGLELKQLRTVCFGDPAGAQKPVVTAMSSPTRDVKSHFDIVRDGIHILVGHDERGNPQYEHKAGWGWHIIPGEMRINKRLEAVRARMSLLINGHPAFVVCPSCTEAIEALSSYHYKIRADGRQELDPFKDHSSHLSNAIEYAVTRLYHLADDEEDEDVQKPPRTVSAASHPNFRR